MTARTEEAMMDRAMTVGMLRLLLEQWDAKQKLVFSDPRYGDFDLVGPTGVCLSPDNFEKDIRPILRLAKRV